METDIEKIIDDIAKNASNKQIFMLFWWHYFNTKKKAKFIACMLKGMSFHYAFKEAKK